MLKIELHSHTVDDPRDDIAHSAQQLIDRASDLGYDAIAITLHDKQLETIDDIRAPSTPPSTRTLLILHSFGSGPTSRQDPALGGTGRR